MKYITRTIWILSLISFFTDTASEMLYPVIPIYLKTIGFSVFLIGVLEGIAEATTGLSKAYFGKLSDISQRRAPFVQIGYALSAISKPLMVLFTYPLWVFFTRTMDRLGKGIRTSARDAMLSDEATPQTKGKIFGFHRSMDTFGAVVGPSIAILYLYFYPQDYKNLFYIALLPGIIAVVISFLLKDKQTNNNKVPIRQSFKTFFKYWTTSSVDYKKVTIGLLVFTLFNSSDMFLLLKAKQAGLDDSMVIGVYIFYNLVYALFAFPMGILGDRIGLKKTIIIGLCLFSSVYFGMAFNNELSVFFILFFLYGLYAAATEGVSKALITNVSDKKDTATAVGTYTALQSLLTFVASSFAGFLWYKFGAEVTFILTAIVTFLVALYFAVIKINHHF